MERVPNNEVLKRVGEKRTLIGSIVERRSSVVGHLLRGSPLIEGRSGKGKAHAGVHGCGKRR